MQELIHKLKSGFKWLVVCNISVQVFTWFVSIIVARNLSPDDYGLFGLVTLVLSFIVMVNEAGFLPAIIQAQKINKTMLSSSFFLFC